MYIHIHTHTWSGSKTDIYIHTYIHTYIHVHTHTYTHMTDINQSKIIETLSNTTYENNTMLIKL